MQNILEEIFKHKNGINQRFSKDLLVMNIRFFFVLYVLNDTTETETQFCRSIHLGDPFRVECVIVFSNKNEEKNNNRKLGIQFAAIQSTSTAEKEKKGKEITLQ